MSTFHRDKRPGFYRGCWRGWWDKLHPRFHKPYKPPHAPWWMTYHYEPFPIYAPGEQPSIKEELQQQFTQYIDFLTACAKGRIDRHSGRRFYQKFLSNYWQYSKPSTIEGVVDVLQDAWWIEEEDIRQQLLIWTWDGRLYWPDHRRGRYSEGCEKRLEERLYIWMMKQKVFSRNGLNTDNYIEELQRPQPAEPEPENILLVINPEDTPLQKLDIFPRYIFYLHRIKKLSQGKIATILGAERQQVRRWQKKYVDDFESNLGEITL